MGWRHQGRLCPVVRSTAGETRKKAPLNKCQLLKSLMSPRMEVAEVQEYQEAPTDMWVGTNIILSGAVL
jgi:hypothetical protein